MNVLRTFASSGIPTFAVLGNHDWGLNYLRSMQTAGSRRDTVPREPLVRHPRHWHDTAPSAHQLSAELAYFTLGEAH